jgi:radical SAM-linked protein
MMRALELAAGRAGAPLRYTQGFNPHPILSLPAPRPVGVSSEDDLLVMSLESPVQAEDLLAGLAAQAPEGVLFLHAQELKSKGHPRPVRIDYVLQLTEAEIDRVRMRLEELKHLAAWPVERLTRPKNTRRGKTAPLVLKVIDVKPMIADLELAGDRLNWSVVPQGDTWARCGDVLELLGLDPRVRLADVVRTAVAYAPDGPIADKR